MSGRTRRQTAPRIRLGVSACLLGEKVRYDGGDKHQPWLTGTLARHVELVPLCPEFAVGLGVPREPMRLEGNRARPRAVVIADGRDVTTLLESYGRRVAREQHDLSGLILKARSPSCGLQVKVHGAPARGRGPFARELTAALPLLPVIDEEGLGDPLRRDAFLESVFALRRWQDLMQRSVSAARLRQFHATHRLLLLAHSPTRLRALEAVIDLGGSPRLLADRYGREFMAAFALTATPRKEAGVLRRLARDLKGRLSRAEMKELLTAIAEWRNGAAPAAAPLALLRQQLRDDPGLADQCYLWPGPAERMLRCR